MPLSDEKDKKIEEWFSASADDLKSANLLYDNKLFAGCIYHLQQSNEKLTKALLLSIGIMSPKRTPEDWRTESVLGFLPKQPSAYRHKMLPHLIADIEKAVPSIEEFLKLVKESKYLPNVSKLDNTIRTSKKGVRELKKKPPVHVETSEQLEIEVKAAQAILDDMEKTTTEANRELEKLDYAETLRKATLWAKELGIRIDTWQPEPDFNEIKAGVVRMLRLAVLSMLSTALASLLDPLEQITRYPDSQHPSFDQNNPFVKNFSCLYDVIRQCLDRSLTTFRSKSRV